MKLSSVLNPEFVYTGLSGRTAQEIYAEMLRRMLPAMELEGDIPGMVQEMTAREDAIGVTYDGVAYPHLRLDGYDDLVKRILPSQAALGSTPTETST